MQTEAQSGRAGPTPAELYEQYFVPGMFRPLAERLLRVAAPRPGESMLDLACGTGILARLAAPAIGPSGRAVALDLRPGMLAAARALPAPAGAPIEWVEGDATALDLADESFDLVCCQQGLQFFADRAAALREVRRVLKPGGRAVFALWHDLSRQGLFGELAPFEKAALDALEIDSSDVDLPFTLGDAGELRGLLENAGFQQVKIEPVSIETDFPAAGFIESVEYAYSAVVPDFVANPAAFRQFTDGLNKAAATVLGAYTQGDRIRFQMNANIATGHR